MISLITSMFNSKEFINSFMENILEQTIFDKCELIIIDANKKSEKHFIQKYLKNKNIKYNHISDFGLDQDPGVYGCWNLAIKNSTGKYITNTNIDDRRAIDAIEKQFDLLESKKYIDLVYYRTLETDKSNESMDSNSASKEFPCLDFSFNNLLKVNSPHCQPMWKRSLHDEFGYFNETLRFAADYDMWLRAAEGGVKMQKINETLGLYYRNPCGVSSKEETLKEAVMQVNQLKMQYIQHA